MILEVAMLDVRPGGADAFESAFAKAAPLLAGSPGYLSHSMRRCLEVRNRYLLLVEWRTLEDHTVGFRGSAAYQDWKAHLHHFYEPFPTVEHYESLP